MRSTKLRLNITPWDFWYRLSTKNCEALERGAGNVLLSDLKIELLKMKLEVKNLIVDSHSKSKGFKLNVVREIDSVLAILESLGEGSPRFIQYLGPVQKQSILDGCKRIKGIFLAD